MYQSQQEGYTCTCACVVLVGNTWDDFWKYSFIYLYNTVWQVLIHMFWKVVGYYMSKNWLKSLSQVKVRSCKNKCLFPITRPTRSKPCWPKKFNSKFNKIKFISCAIAECSPHSLVLIQVLSGMRIFRLLPDFRLFGAQIDAILFILSPV